MAINFRSDSLSKPIIIVDTKLAPGVSVPTSITAQLVFNGVAGPVTTYNASTLTAGGVVRFSLQADGSSLATGVYDYTLEVTTVVNGVSSMQTFPGKRAIVNRNASEFGSGWGLDGLDRLYESPSGIMVVRGNGDSLWFEKSGSSYLHAPGDTSYTSIVKNPNGSYTLTSKTGIVSSFSSTGMLLSRRDATNNVVSFVYVDANSDGLAAEISSVTDAFGRVVSFGYLNGRVSTISHFSGRTATLSFDNGTLTKYKLTDPDATGVLLSPQVAFEYNGRNLKSRTNAVNEKTSFDYGSADSRLRSVTYPDSSVGISFPLRSSRCRPIASAELWQSQRMGRQLFATNELQPNSVRTMTGAPMYGGFVQTDLAGSPNRLQHLGSLGRSFAMQMVSL